MRTTGEPLVIPATDGRCLSACAWMGPEAAARAVVFLPAMGAPQGYASALASWLATRGWGAVTFDYRGIGASWLREDYRAITVDDWIHRDLPAVILAIRRLTGCRFLGVIAHSVGGQIFGQSPACANVDGAVFLGAQHGVPRFFRGRGRARIEYAYRVFPVVVRLLGHVPTSSITFPDRVPPRALIQWIRWGREGVFRDAGGRDTGMDFGRYTGRLVAARVADDAQYAPEAAVEALTRLYKSASLSRVVLHPKEFGVERVGHFGLFSRRAPRLLWSRIESWLREMSESPEYVDPAGSAAGATGLAHAVARSGAPLTEHH
jgi:predicted alpha/beta hydrolase